MTTSNTTTTKPNDEPKPTTVEMFKMRAVHGLLIHPDGTRFDTDKDLPHVKDNWTTAQIDGKKLKIV